MLQRQESAIRLQREQVYQLVNLQFDCGHFLPQNYEVWLILLLQIKENYSPETISLPIHENETLAALCDFKESRTSVISRLSNLAALA